MSPELEQLLRALYEKRTCPPEEKSHRDATFERLLQDTLAAALPPVETNCWTLCMSAMKSSVERAANRQRCRTRRDRLEFREKYCSR